MPPWFPVSAVRLAVIGLLSPGFRNPTVVCPMPFLETIAPPRLFLAPALLGHLFFRALAGVDRQIALQGLLQAHGVDVAAELPPCAIEMPPVSSETTMMIASEISLMPIAARWRVP